MEKLAPSKKNFILLIIISAFRFMGDSYFYSFLTRYFKTFITDDFQLGLLTALIPFMAVIGNLLVSNVATSFRKRKIIFLIWTVLESAGIIAFGFYKAFWYVLVLDIICNFCSNSFYNLWDTFLVAITDRAGKSYASGRFFGTLFYLIGVFSGGLVLTDIGYPFTFLIAGSMMIIAGIFFLFLTFTNEDIAKMDREEDSGGKSTYKEVFKNKGFILYMFVAAVFLGCIWASDNIFNQYTADLKVNDRDFGFSYGSTMIGEGLMLLLFSRVKKPSTFKKLLMASIAIFIFRVTMFAIPNLNPTVYLVVESLRGVSYGLILVTNINLIKNILGVKLRYPGFFLLVAIDELFAAIVDLVGPRIITLSSYTVMFSSFAALGALCLLGLFFVKLNPPLEENLKEKTSKQEEEQKPIINA
ncbi:MAG: MFS transporter [Bacilli bacterium]|jgi:MFS family permease|nr:MFS transporter [Bacilli bacterium]